jgi:hypothetical protein
MANQFAPLTTGTDSLGTAALVWKDAFVGKLGQSIDVNGFGLVSVSDGDILIQPNGTGQVQFTNYSFPSADGSADQVLKTSGSGALTFQDETFTLPYTGVGTSTTGTDFDLSTTSLTSGNLMKLSNSGATVLTGDLLHIETNINSTGRGLFINALGTEDGMRIYKDDDGKAIEIETLSSSGYAVDIKDSGGGGALLINNDSTGDSVTLQNSGTEVLTIADTGAIGVGISASRFTLPVVRGTNNQVLRSNGSGVVTWEDQAGGGLALPFDGTGTETTVSEFNIDNNQVFTGTTQNAMISYRLENASASGELLNLRHDGTGRVLVIDQNGNNFAINIQSAATSSAAILIGMSSTAQIISGSTLATSSDAVQFTCNSLTGGNGVSVLSSSVAFTGGLVRSALSGNNANVTGATFEGVTSGASSNANVALFVGATLGETVFIQQDTTAATALVIDQNTNAFSLNIDSAATTADTINIGSIGSGDALQIIQSGTGNILKLLDGGTEAFVVSEKGTATSTSSATSGGAGFVINMTGSESILDVQDSGTSRLLMVNDASGAVKVLFTTAGSSTGFAHNHTGTGTAFELQDGGTSVFSVADGGNITSTGELNIDNMIMFDIPNSADEARGIGFNYTSDVLLSIGRVVAIGASSDEVQLADANVSSKQAVGITISSTDGSANQPVKVLTVGVMQSATFVGLGSQGSKVYVSGTAGNLTLTAPAGSGDFVQVIGIYDDATNGSISFNFNSNGTEDIP